MTMPALMTLKLMPPLSASAAVVTPASASNAIGPARRADEVRMGVCSLKDVDGRIGFCRRQTYCAAGLPPIFPCAGNVTWLADDLRVPRKRLSEAPKMKPQLRPARADGPPVHAPESQTNLRR